MTGGLGLPSGTPAGSQTRHRAVQSWSCSESSVEAGAGAGVGVGVTAVDVADRGAACWSAGTGEVGGRRGTGSAGEDSGIPGNHTGTEGAIPGSLAPFSLWFSVIQAANRNTNRLLFDELNA